MRKDECMSAAECREVHQKEKLVGEGGGGGGGGVGG
jgi:hypothetical protein